ncbi:MAG: CoA-binding protein [Cyanobacteria bacterium P01_A01_bin.105]
MTPHDYHNLGHSHPTEKDSDTQGLKRSGQRDVNQPIKQPETAIRQILTAARTIAVIGHSHKPHRASYQVALYLRHQGYLVYPVNPQLEQIEGVRCYPTLQSIPAAIDIVNVFRRREFLPAIAQEVQALSTQPACVWTQLDIYDAAVARQLRAAGITVVMDTCLKIEHQRMLGAHPA